MVLKTQLFHAFDVESLTEAYLLQDTVRLDQKRNFWKWVWMVSAIFIDFQLFYFLTRIIADNLTKLTKQKGIDSKISLLRNMF
jgi:hypothetical protein